MQPSGHPRIRALRRPTSTRRRPSTATCSGWSGSPRPRAGTSSSAAATGVLLLFNAEATEQPPPPDAGCRCRRTAPPAQGHLCFSATRRRDRRAGRPRLERQGHRDRSRFRMAERRALDLFPRPVRQFARIRRTADLGTVMRTLEGKKIVVASHNDGKLREFADLMAPFGFEAKSASGIRPAGAGRDRHDLRGERLHQGARRGEGHRPAGAVGRFRPVRRRARRRSPASTPPTGPRRRTARATSRMAMQKVEDALAGSGATDAGAAHRPLRRGASALPGRTAMPSISAARSKGTLVWPPRGDTGLRLRSGVPAGRPRTHIRRNDAPRKSTAGSRARPRRCRTAPAPSRNSREPVWARHDAMPTDASPASASMSTGRSARPSAPIATSTAMSATSRSTRSASPRAFATRNGDDARAHRPARR